MISRTMLACGSAVVAVATASPAMAQRVQFDIPAQDISAAISTFGRQSGLQVIAPVDHKTSKRSHAVKGMLDARTALNILIEGTGLEIASDKGDVIILRRDAQVQGAADEQSTGSDIVVTAQKRPEVAQKVPITLTAFSSKDLANRNIEDVSDLASFTPGLVTSKFSYGQPIFAIRGADNTFSAAGAAKPIGVFIDDVYLPRFSASNISLADVQSVSVLKGPQGTLFGRNVTAGAILIQTREPSLADIQANARAGIGNYGLYEFSGYMSAPLSDQAAGSVSIDRQKRNGFGKDILNGKKEDDADSWSGRAQLVFKPSDMFKLRLSGDYEHAENGGRALSALTGSDTNRRTSELGVQQTYRANIAGTSARIELGDGPVKVTSVTAYRYSKSFEIFSRTGLSFRSLASQFQEIGEEQERDSAFSQEARVSYDSQAVNLVTGLFYFDQHSRRGLRKYRLAARTGATSLDNFYDQDVKTTSIAPFADATWHVTDQLDLTGGVRYTYERKEAQERLTNRTAPASSFLGNDDHSWRQVTYRTVATYRPTDDITLYGSHATGFTAGGYNTEADVIAAFRNTFKPETSSSYEIGLKSRFADGRGRLNIAGFTTRYKDKQEFVFNNLTFVGNITNATRAKAKGIEAELGFSPIQPLTINATLAYMDAKYGTYVIPGGAVQTGNKLGKSPPWSYSIAADLDQPISATLRMLASISFAHKDRYFPSASNTLPIPNTNLLDGQVGLASTDEHWRLMVWGRNLTNRKYPLILSNFVVNAEWLAPPRTYGLRVSYKY
ncbi:TonB-dependent receptor [Sphingomonas crocodyli]|nr:TonB-dependent receptor [Sphingomonas crocodyli]